MSHAIATLLRAVNPAPCADAELLLAHVLRRDRAWILAHPEAPVHAATAGRFHRLLRRLVRGEPLSYLTGERWFSGRALRVTRDSLIPRPETELLIDLALRHLRSETLDSKSQILDIGTGSGCIAVTLAAECQDAQITAIDASIAALRIARANARRHGVTERIRFLHGDLLEPANKFILRREAPKDLAPVHRDAKRSMSPAVSWDPSLRIRFAQDKLITLVLANLPYLTTREWRALPRAIRNFEPRQALDGGPDGLQFFRVLFHQLHALAASSRQLTTLLEIDPRRKRALSALVRRMLPKWSTAWHRDLAGHWRVLELHPQRSERAIG